MACADCGFLLEPFKDWGFLTSPSPLYECGHADVYCRRCDSCSAWWHRPGMENESEEGDILRVDCPDCVAEDERAAVVK